MITLALPHFTFNGNTAQAPGLVHYFGTPAQDFNRLVYVHISFTDFALLSERLGNGLPAIVHASSSRRMEVMVPVIPRSDDSGNWLHHFEIPDVIVEFNRSTRRGD